MWACTHISMLSCARLSKEFLWTQPAAYCLIFIQAAFDIHFIYGEQPTEWIVKLCEIDGVLILALTVVIPLLAALSAPALRTDACPTRGRGPGSEGTAR